MNTRIKGLLALGVAAAGLVAAIAFTPSSAWADPPGGWGPRPYYNGAVSNNNGGMLAHVFGNGYNNYHRPNNGWFRGNGYYTRNGWFGGNNGWFNRRNVGWGGAGYGRYGRAMYRHRGFW